MVNKILAALLERFKLKNPKVWAFAVFILSILHFGAQQGADLGVFAITGDVANIVNYITWALALLLGSKTFNILNGDKMQVLIDENRKIRERNEELRDQNEALSEELGNTQEPIVEPNNVIPMYPKASKRIKK